MLDVAREGVLTEEALDYCRDSDGFHVFVSNENSVKQGPLESSRRGLDIKAGVDVAAELRIIEDLPNGSATLIRQSVTDGSQFGIHGRASREGMQHEC